MARSALPLEVAMCAAIADARAHLVALERRTASAVLTNNPLGLYTLA